MPLTVPQTITLICLTITISILLIYATIEILYYRWRNKPSPRTHGLETVGTELERAKKKRVRTGANNIPQGTRIWAIWDKQPRQSKTGAMEQKRAERVVDDWVERGEGWKSTMMLDKPGKTGKVIKAIRPPSSPALEWEDEDEDKDSETELASQYSLGWTYPLPELVRDGKKGGKLVDEEKGRKVKKGKRVPGSWFRDV